MTYKQYLIFGGFMGLAIIIANPFIMVNHSFTILAFCFGAIFGKGYGILEYKNKERLNG